MTPAELSALDEKNLISTFRNPSVADALRLDAAILLYKRNSRYCQNDEFQPWKPRVLDSVLKNYKDNPPTFAENTPYAALGRIYEVHQALGDSLAETTRRHEETMSANKTAHEAADEELHNRVDQLAASAATSDLGLAIAAARHRRAVEKQLDQHSVELITRDEEIAATVATEDAKLKAAIENQGSQLKVEIEKVRKTLRRVIYAFGAAIPAVTAIGMYLIKFLK